MQQRSPCNTLAKYPMGGAASLLRFLAAAVSQCGSTHPLLVLSRKGYQTSTSGGLRSFAATLGASVARIMLPSLSADGGSRGSFTQKHVAPGGQYLSACQMPI